MSQLTVFRGVTKGLRIMVAGRGEVSLELVRRLRSAGYCVIFYDISPAVLERVSNLVEKATSEIETVRECDLILENLPDSLAVKARFYEEASRLAPQHTVIASTTSLLSVSELASLTDRPGLIAGFHLLSWALDDLVEVVKGLATQDTVIRLLKDLAVNLGFVPVEVLDMPGFAGNRMLYVLINEAAWCLHDGVAAPADIDKMMPVTRAPALGPLALADTLGLDTVLAGLKSLHRRFGDPKYRPCPLLANMVGAGWLGQKTGQGFYQYGQ